MSKIKSFLHQLNLSDIEIDIYLNLLKTGPLSTTQLAKQLNIPRTTIHENTDKLIKKGLISRTIVGTNKKLIAEPPTKINTLLSEQLAASEHHQHTLKSMQQKLPDLIDSIYATYQETASTTDFDVKIYKGKEEVAKVYQEIVKSNEIRSYVDTKAIQQLFPGNFKLFIHGHRNNPKQIAWEINVPPANFENSYFYNLDPKRFYCKNAPVNLVLPLAINLLIYDGKVAIINLTKILIAIVINNEPYYQNARASYDFIWQTIADE